MARLAAVFDCMMWTIVITCKTRDTFVCVQPSWLEAESAFDIVCRTDVSADATLHTTALINAEWLICKKPFDKQISQDIRVDTRPMALMDRSNTVLAILNARDILSQ